MQIQAAIAEIKKRENAVILAHYYVPDEVQAAADYVGDSYYLAKAAMAAEAETIVFCGVHFMGESAKILNPSKRVLMPELSADCPMAHMADRRLIEKLRAETDSLAVVCYINSTAELKALSDVTVTSSNAVKIVRSLKEKNILFIPDANLGSFVAEKVPEKNFYFSGGYCPVHASLLAADVAAEKAAHPGAEVLTHPECTEGVRALSDFIGSTADIIRRAGESGAESFIVCTEPGVLYELQTRYPSKRFIPVSMACADMKKNTLEALYACLAEGKGEVRMGEEEMNAARRPLERMLELAK